METLCLVVPCYNEEEILPDTINTLSDFIRKGSKWNEDSFIIFVDDGSTDRTWEIIEQASKDPVIKGVRLSHNKGHQNALLCGLMEANRLEADMVISIDADLQDDLSVIPEMVDKYYDGADIVCGVRKSRKTDSFLKRTTAQCYYKFLKLMGVDTIYNHADYRLMSAQMVQNLLAYNESNLFLRGIIPLLSNHIEVVYYDRLKREKGKSKYTLKKMMKLSADGITSFSIVPIKLIFLLGLLMMFISAAFIMFFIAGKFNGTTVDGWTSLIVSIWFGIGLNLMATGVVGEYVGKTYLESKHRPRFQIRERTKNRQ